MADMPVPNLGLAFADATNIAAKSGSPVVFAASNIGRGYAGGGSSTVSDSDAQTSNPDASAPVVGSAGGAGGSGGGGLLDSVLPSLISSGLGYGLNGGQVQAPQAKQQAYGAAPTITTGTAATKTSAAPGPIAIVGLLALAGVAFFFVRG